MSLRNMTVQYIGSTLTTPPFEREVKRIEVGGVTFVPEQTCQLIEDGDLLHCSECGGVAEERLWKYWHYCPNCGARVTLKNSETTPKVVSE